MRKNDTNSGSGFYSGLIFLTTVLLLFSSLPAAAAPVEMMEPKSRSLGASTGDLFGTVIRADGDLNGDGITDVVIGAPGAGGGDGKVYIYISPSQGITSFSPSSANCVISGNSSQSGSFGASISFREDINGDGRKDLVIGAPGEDMVYIFLGRLLYTSTLGVSDADLVYCGPNGSKFGESVDISKDFNGDGDPDVIIGAPDLQVFIFGDQGPGYYPVGAALIFTNASNHLSLYSGESVSYTMADVNLTGDSGNVDFGEVVAGVGDINGDGLNDTAVGDPGYSSGAGGVFIMYGRSFFDQDNYTAPQLLLLKGRSSSRFGSSILPLGDVADTPEDDLLVGAPNDYNLTGAAYMFFGSTSFTSVDLSTGSASVTFMGNDTGDKFGTALAFTGNFTGQGLGTIFIGAPGRTEGGVSGRGVVYGFYGPFTSSQERASDADTYYLGETSSQALGSSLGAYDRPGVDWVLAGSPSHSSGTGIVIALERNYLPRVGGLFINPPNKGNRDTVFTIQVVYQDSDGDPPEYVRLHIYSDSSGTEELIPPINMARKNSTSPHYEVGELYEVRTTLPNSITPDNDQKKLYLAVEAKAQRGSVTPVFSHRPPLLKMGPYVDALPPAPVTTLQAYTEPATSWDDEGRIKLYFEFPAENVFNGTEVGKVSRLIVKMRHNENITEENWEDENTTTVLDLTGESILDPGSMNSEGYLLGPEHGLLPGELYYFAIKSYDDVGNEAPLSNIASAKAGKYWDTVAPQPVTILDARDRPNDFGGVAELEWEPVGPADIRDFKEYRIYVRSEYFNNVENYTPELVIEDPSETTAEITTADGGQPLQNGRFYWFAVMAVDVFDNYNPHVTPFGPVRIKNDSDVPPPIVRNLRGYDTPDDEGGAVTLEWDYFSVDDFLLYYVWVSTSPITDISKAELFTTIPHLENHSVVVNKYLGVPLQPGRAYYFAVTVMDFNEKMNTTLTDNNTAGPIYAFDNTDHTPPTTQVKGVTLSDTPFDNGGSLDLSWIASYEVADFWKYRIYLSDEPITTVSGMEPLIEIYEQSKSYYQITTFRGERLVDGKPYWAAVTVVDWNDNENTLLDMNNTAGPAEPINNSDTIPPPRPEGLEVLSVGYNFINVSWYPMTFEDVPDFNYYLVSYRVKGTKRVYETQVPRRSQNWANITGLQRGKNYVINVSIVDDNGNQGPFSESIEVWTLGINQPPHTVEIWILPDNRTVFEVGDTITIIAHAEDDYTDPLLLEYFWNITTPDGKYLTFSEKIVTRSFTKPGKYTVTLYVVDEEGLRSENVTLKITIKEPTGVTQRDYGPYILGGLIAAVVVAVAGFFLFGKRSKEKIELEEHVKRFVEERRRIKEDEPYIYPGIPTWTCSCGKTTVPINDSATCDVCFDSFEGVPVEQIDQWLEEHKEILDSMRIKVPEEWPGSERAVEIAEKARRERIRRKLEELMKSLSLTPEILKEHGVELEEWEMPREEKPPEQPPAAAAPPAAPLQPRPVQPKPLQPGAQPPRPPAPPKQPEQS